MDQLTCTLSLTQPPHNAKLIERCSDPMAWKTKELKQRSKERIVTSGLEAVSRVSGSPSSATRLRYALESRSHPSHALSLPISEGGSAAAGWAYAPAAAEGVVHHEGQLVAGGDRLQAGEVRHVVLGVADGLAVDGLSVFTHTRGFSGEIRRSFLR
jgi:hypothetical protein